MSTIAEDESREDTAGSSTDHSANNSFKKLLQITIEDCKVVVNAPTHDDSFKQVLDISENESNDENVEAASEDDSSIQQKNEVLLSSHDSANENTRDLENVQEELKSDASPKPLPIAEAVLPENTTELPDRLSELLNKTRELLEDRAESPNKTTPLNISQGKL